MSMMNDEDAVQGATRTMQIIVAALAGGVVLFWAMVTLVLPNAGGPKPPAAAAGPDILGLPLLTAMAIVFGLVSVVASFLVPKVVVDGALGQIAKGMATEDSTASRPGAKQVYPASEVAKLLPVYSTQLIIASALNEGAAFFAGIAYMLEHHPATIGVAGVLVALLLSRFPTTDRVQGWLEAQLERLTVKRRDDF
ncbi:hypothetical protein [Paludisphaera mucosa]|uniref:Uncharacterized protein n=1 Tax=Paludisphaera mucosa TaxID=3030827 RepID=A0ABT6FEQ4_9BACT|nr:hypothetical protein [Paludisphaera mucosa]MDG3006052.1 hypothetical protein [Paludisphaera mucosa]